jgi:NhaP-type Na+/H+ or K+/H+ antiporter
MLAAVSPAVVVPSMLELKQRGFGSRNGVVTIVLAGASVDDVVAITLFTLFLGFALPGAGGGVSGIGAAGAGAVFEALAVIPLSIIGGLGVGLMIGWGLSWYFARHHERIRATEKTLVLLSVAILLVQVGEWIHIGTLLGVMTMGFVLLERNERAAHELAAKLGKIWVFAQIILFVLIGMSVDPILALQAGPKALALLAGGLLFRSAGVLLSTMGSPLSWGERFFCVIAYLPKATVQAALGGVALARGVPEGGVILAIAVLSIIVTAPIGLLGIRSAAPRLLHGEQQPGTE